MGVALQRIFKLTPEKIIMNTITYRNVTHYGSVETVSTLRTASSGSSEGWQISNTALLNGSWLASLWADYPVARPLLHKRKVRKNPDTNHCLFGSKTIEIMGNWIKLHIQELHDLHSLPKIIGVFKYGRWDGHGKWHVWGERRAVYRVLLGNMREREHLEDLSVDGSVMLKWTFKKWDGREWPGLIWLGMGTVDRFLWTR